MKKIAFPFLATSVFLLASCATQQLAQQGNVTDDVYYTEARAKEITIPARASDETPKERSYRTDEQLYGGNDYSDEEYYDDYDYGYASRLSRFHGRSPWRTRYFDSWYSYSYYPWYTYRYDPFYYDPWFYRPGVNIWVGVGTFPRYGWYNDWAYYGSPYYSRYWGPYSYYSAYPGYGYYGGGYYGGGYYGDRYNRPNYRTRPNRETGMSGGTMGGNTAIYGRPSASGSSTSGRPDRSTPNSTINGNEGRVSSRPGANSSSRPVTRPTRPNPNSSPAGSGNSSPRTQETTQPSEQSRPSRPARTTTPEQTRESTRREEPRSTEYERPSRPARPSYTPSPSYDSGRSSGGSSNGGGSSSSGSGSSSGGGRPSRGGR